MKKEDYKLGFKIYELAREGYNKKQMAASLGMTIFQFNKKIKEESFYTQAIFLGRNCPNKQTVQSNNESFADYVIGRLPEPIREIWEKIAVFEKEEKGTAKIEAIFESGGKKLRQYIFVHAFIVSNFSLSQACKKANISLSQLNVWKQEPEFADMLNMIDRYKKDFFEGHLINAVSSGETSAIIFANKTYNKDLGYSEKVELSVNGEMNLNHNFVDIEELELPLETKKQILEAIRKNKGKNNE